MTLSEFAERVKSALPYTPNGQQSLVIEALARFCSPVQNKAHKRDRVFVLNGYAGTGKTSIVGALVKALGQASIKSVLMAPTGRAAKVFAANAAQAAYTIHRRIYRHSLNGGPPGMQENREHDVIFIVDEASMISADDEPSGLNLLRDLIHYVYSAPGCRMILVGDTAQLPPVGCEASPAMDTGVLRGYGLAVSSATLTAVARQDALSGILANATWQRRAMRANPMPEPKIFTDGYTDVKTVFPEDLFEAIDTAYRNDGIDRTMVITRSNKRAAEFNRAIRTEVLYMDDEIAGGEMLLVAKNNYFWSKGMRELDFLANGEILVVERVHGTESKYGLRFANVTLSLVDRSATFEAKVLLNTLNSDAAALSSEQMNAFYQAVMTDPELFDSTMGWDVRLRQLRQNPYWNALQVKYAYAVTCHKAQGGQWENVIVDMTYIAPESIGLEFYRWLYTATTRARHNLLILATPSW